LRPFVFGNRTRSARRRTLERTPDLFLPSIVALLYPPSSCSLALARDGTAANFDPAGSGIRSTEVLISRKHDTMD
jgi:hypothetical protein